jgi:hypothetical protein
VPKKSEKKRRPGSKKARGTALVPVAESQVDTPAEVAGVGEETALRPGAVSQPQNWDTAVAAAYLRLIDATQREAAEGTGVSLRTIQCWEISPWWKDAEREAADRWLHDVRAKARKALAKSLDFGFDPGTLALKVLERTETALAPPAQQVEHRGRIGHFVVALPPLDDNSEGEES